MGHALAPSDASPDAPQVQDALQALLQLLLRKKWDAWGRPRHIYNNLPRQQHVSTDKPGQPIIGAPHLLHSDVIDRGRAGEAEEACLGSGDHCLQCLRHAEVSNQRVLHRLCM